MFERFTERARQVVVLAQQEARELGYGHIGTEHLLLGLLCESDGIAARALRSFGLDLDDARACVLRLVPAPEPSSGPPALIPFTPRAKKALEQALREALRVSSGSIGTEHVLLGLLGVGDSAAVAVLRECGVAPETVAARTIDMLAAPPGPELRAGRTAASRHAAASLTASRGRTLPPDVIAFLAEIGREIREQLGREPDIGDYWLALASVPGSLSERLLAELGTDKAALAQAVERAREHGGSPLGGLTPDQAARHARLMLGLSSPD